MPIPGRLFALVILGLVALELYSASLPGYANWHLPLLGLWALAGLAWLIWLIAAMFSTPRPPTRRWLGWLPIPLVVLMTFELVSSDVPVRIRFALSRGALDAYVGEAAAHPTEAPPHPRTLGLYEIDFVERSGDSVRIGVAGTGGCLFCMGGGFAWRESGVSPHEGGDDDYRHLDGGWWVWVAGW